MNRRYIILDVFTDTALAGNPLAVVRDADGLDTAGMQAIAKEFNLSETVFLLPADNPAHSARARIFTPAREIPFAGHPTVGTAIHVASERFDGSAEDLDAVVVLEEGVGPVRCGVALKQSGAHYAEFDLPKLPVVADLAPSAEIVAQALGLAAHEIGFSHFPVAVSDAGLSFLIVPVNGVEAVRRAKPRLEHWEDLFPEPGLTSGLVYLFSAEVERPDASFHTRMFAPLDGIPEDPATGSAAAAFAGVLHRFGQLTEGSHSYLIEQGFEMGRPSLISLELDIAETGALHAARIGGHAVVVAEGVLKL